MRVVDLTRTSLTFLFIPFPPHPDDDPPSRTCTAYASTVTFGLDTTEVVPSRLPSPVSHNQHIFYPTRPIPNARPSTTPSTLRLRRDRRRVSHLSRSALRTLLIGALVPYAFLTDDLTDADDLTRSLHSSTLAPCSALLTSLPTLGLSSHIYVSQPSPHTFTSVTARSVSVDSA